jgi:hypothetical protein
VKVIRTQADGTSEASIVGFVGPNFGGLVLSETVAANAGQPPPKN